MDVVLGFGLGGVERMQRVRVVVAEHARAIHRRLPVLQGERLDQVLIPAAHLVRRAAPIAVARVQHVVLEVLELLVRRLRAVEVDLGVGQEQPLPQVGIHAFEMTQRVERQLVVRAGRMPGIDDVEKQVHGAAFRKWCRKHGATRANRPTIGESGARANVDIPRLVHGPDIVRARGRCR